MDAIEKFVDSMLGEDIPVDEETLSMSLKMHDVLNSMLDAYITDDMYEDNLRNILEEDEYLTQELVDKICFLNVIEGSPRGTFSKEEIEHVYLSIIDSFFELSKEISPLAGFGKDRLLAGLDIIKEFEKDHWPLSTQITKENTSAFSELIPMEHFEDIVAGRKHAIGALRCVGDEMYAAGVIVYSAFDEDGDSPSINVDWIETHESLRARGVANFLMALLLEIAYFSDDNVYELTVSIPVSIADNEEELQNIDAAENFFDSWKFGFLMSFRPDFVISFSDLKKSDVFPKRIRTIDANTKNLSELGRGAEILLSDFFSQVGSVSEGVVNPISFKSIDPDVSFVTILDGQIASAILFKKLQNGDYRFEGFFYKDKNRIMDLTRLLPALYIAADKKERDFLITGRFRTEEGVEIATKMLPCLHVPMVYQGSMSIPKDYFSSDEWGKLREMAGFSNGLIPDEELSEDEIAKQDEEHLRQFVAENGFKES